LLDAAVNPDEMKEKSQLCEMDFYAAEKRALWWFPIGAKAKFRAALRTCPVTFVEYEGAYSELRRPGISGTGTK
jgi:hypothetical protein